MTLRRYMTIFALTALLSAGAQQINPLTQAMLDGYEQLLKQNPEDFFTLYERAQQYYRLSRYDLALNDIKKAIAFTPSKDKAQLSAEYSLCADIYTQTKEYALALEAVNNALECSPNSYPLLYMKGNICLYLNDLTQAQSTFQAMLRIQSRSQEAMIGLAKIAIRQGDIAKAEGYISQAEKLDQSNYLTYCRIGDLHDEMNNTRQAAADYISAYCLNTSSERPLSAMLRLAAKDYKAATEAIDYALSHTSNYVTLNFLRGNIAVATGHFSDAYESYRHIIDGNAQTKPILAPVMAKICLSMGNLTEANDYATLALAEANNEQNNLVKAMVEEANGNIASALIYAGNALRINPQSNEASILAASLRIASQEWADAISVINAALLYEPSNVPLLLMRGFINRNMHNEGDTDYHRVTSENAETPEEMTYKAIAQLLSGMRLDADATIKPVLDLSDTDPKAAFLSALYYNNGGQKELAIKYRDKAVDLGYEDEYLLRFSKNPVLSLSNLR